MEQDRWNTINEVFTAWLEKDPEEQAHFLAEACGDDQNLRSEVQHLIDAHRKADDFIETPILDQVASSIAADEESLKMEQIGSYRILKEIGRGGMGAVFLGARADQEYEKQVAIKLIKRGMDTEQVLHRFRNERQILANFDHPNIARLLEGGSTANGLPYFVMEYVEGFPIDVYCDQNNLNITSRLELFLQVCSAVSYAHRNLVVHRDIKPSNILVTAEGVPKLLDFGIAKILQTDPADRITSTGILPMTPEYASPEQAKGGNVTTFGDVYSLGVLLYELLTGHPPYQVNTATAMEIVKIITETSPQLPSTVVTESESDLTPAEVSKCREGTPQRLQRRLRGDLDNIVLKAMRKEPEQRYATVDQFADDIRNHLAGLPVIARPVTFSYRLSKFVQRNKMAVALTGLVFFTLIGGIVTTTWQSYRAKAERARAERRFNDVRKLARSVLFDYHDAIKDLPGSTPVRARLVKDALEYVDSLAAEENTDLSLQLELATAYERIGDVQGGTMKANLGDTAGSMKSFRKALSILQTLIDQDPQNKEARRHFAACSRKLGTLLWETGDLQGSLVENRKGLILLQQLVADNPEDIDLRIELAATLNRVGSILLEESDFSGALESHHKELGIYESFPSAARQREDVRWAVANTYEHIATVLISTGSLEKALENNHRGLEIRQSLTKDFPFNAHYLRALAVSFYWEGEILWKMRRQGEALASYQKDIDIVEKLFSQDPNNEVYRGDLSYGLNRVGDLQFELSDTANAVLNYTRSQILSAEDLKADPSSLWKRSSLIGTQAKLCKALAITKQFESAKKEFTATLSLMENTTLEPSNAADRSAFADAYFDLGEAYSVIAMKEPNSSPAIQKSCEMYQSSLHIWQDLQDRRILSNDNLGKIETVSAKIKGCNN